MLFFSLIYNSNTIEVSKSYDSKIFCEAVSFMKNRICDNLSVDEIANCVGISRGGVHKYFLKLKMKQAADMLENNAPGCYNDMDMLITGMHGKGNVGLRWEDCDFDENLISVNHNLIYRLQDNGKCEYHITTPKSNSGIRIIPMLSEVKKALLQEKTKCCDTIDG